MNWYKTAQATQLGRTLLQWLLQAFRGPIDMQQLHQDLDSAIGQDDEGAVSMAINDATNMVLQQTGAMALTPAQQDVIDNVQQRMQSQPQPDMGDSVLTEGGDLPQPI